MFKSLVFSLITKGTVAVINFLVLIVSSRYLGVSSRGEISIFLLNITIIQAINEIYTGYSIVHFIPRYNFKKLAVFGFVYTAVVCTACNSAVLALGKQVKDFEWAGYVISLLVLLNTFNCVLILGKENIKAYNLLSFIQPLLLLTGMLFFIFVLRSYTFAAYVYPLMGSFAAAFILSSVVVLGFLRKKEQHSEFALRPVFAGGFAFQVATLMYIFVNRFSFYLLPGIANVGLYAAASSLMESLLVIVNSISPVLLARVANQGNTLNSADTTLALSKASLAFSALAVLLLLLLPDAFFIAVLGKGFSGIKELMLLYAPGVLMVSFFGSISNYFSAIGKQKLVLYCYSLGFVSTLVLAPVLVSRFSEAGAAYSANISYLLMAIAVCVCFVLQNKLTVRRFFSFSADYSNLRRLAGSGKTQV